MELNMLSKTLNIGPTIFTLALFLGPTLTTSSWAMEVENVENGIKCLSSSISSKKSLNEVKESFLKELGDAAIKFHQEDTERLDHELAPSTESQSLNDDDVSEDY